MTNPGNLLFYDLCDERYEEWASVKPMDRRKGAICLEIVDAFEATGGVFRSKTGEVLDRSAAKYKAKERLRHIGKPKLRPVGFGEEDVVFAQGEISDSTCRVLCLRSHYPSLTHRSPTIERHLAGSATFLYPGNAKFKKMCDGYVLAYWDGVVDMELHGRTGRQVKIINEVITTITNRGGVFRDMNLNVLPHKETVVRISRRFNDMKKVLVSGKRTFVDATADGESARAEMQAASSELTRTEMSEQRIGGFTRVKSVVTERKRKAETNDGNSEKNADDAGPDGDSIGSRGISSPGQSYHDFIPHYSWNCTLADAADQSSGAGHEGHDVVRKHMEAMRKELEEVCGTELYGKLIRAKRSRKCQSSKRKSTKNMKDFRTSRRAGSPSASVGGI